MLFNRADFSPHLIDLKSIYFNLLIYMYCIMKPLILKLPKIELENPKRMCFKKKSQILII
jgi:hypothetical protein